MESVFDLLSCSLKPSDILIMSASLRTIEVRCIVTLEERSEEGIRGSLIAMVEHFVFDQKAMFG